jgi:hypothetical protein
MVRFVELQLVDSDNNPYKMYSLNPEHVVGISDVKCGDHVLLGSCILDIKDMEPLYVKGTREWITRLLEGAVH